MYKASLREDTWCLGTRDFAAPEQFGFAQTDQRTDIYSLGILLRWMLTGSIEKKAEEKTPLNPRLARVLAKSTSLDPKDRYQSPARMKEELSGAIIQKKQILTAAAILLIVLTGLFWLILNPLRQAPVLTEQALTEQADTPLVFQEPILEAAVRASLGKAENEAITHQDALAVTDLYIFGNQTAANAQEFKAHVEGFVHHDPQISRGSLINLQDLTKLKNLRQLSIEYQNITDLTPLSELVYLENISLNHNPISNITPLSKLQSLRSLDLYNTYVSDLTPLKTCPRLDALNLGQTPIRSITALEGLDLLQTLTFYGSTLQSLEGIERLPLLKKIDLTNCPIQDFSPLLKLPQLKEVKLHADQLSDAEKDLPGKVFEIFIY